MCLRRPFGRKNSDMQLKSFDQIIQIRNFALRALRLEVQEVRSTHKRFARAVVASRHGGFGRESTALSKKSAKRSEKKRIFGQKRSERDVFLNCGRIAENCGRIAGNCGRIAPRGDRFGLRFCPKSSEKLRKAKKAPKSFRRATRSRLW